MLITYILQLPAVRLCVDTYFLTTGNMSSTLHLYSTACKWLMIGRDKKYSSIHHVKFAVSQQLKMWFDFSALALYRHIETVAMCFQLYFVSQQ